MNLPNKLTLLRFIFVPLILLSMLPLPFRFAQTWNRGVEHYGMLVALVLFVAAALTDHLDGRLARKYGLITNLGKFLDPIADKVLVLSVFIAFVQRGSCSVFVPVILLFREFAVTGIRLLAVQNGEIIAASWLGKAKMVSQVVAIVVLMFQGIFENFPLPNHFNFLLDFFSWIAPLSLWICILLTLASGYDYLRKSLHYFKDSY